ncbi:MAG: oligosaccharide repeat unit polymerase [Clostridiaceae bacterium]|nr:oligosaccharide repeat unit polymerase [Clostridiaceae bacterium]
MANFILGMLQLLSIIIISIYEYNKRSIVVFLWATLLIMFGIPHLLSIMTNTSDYSDDIMIKASIFVIMFNLLYIITKKFLNTFIFKDSNVSPNTRNYPQISVGRRNRLKMLSLLVLTLGFLILIYYTIKHLGSLSNASWGKFRALSAELGFKSLLRYAKFILFATSGIVLVYLKEESWKMATISIIMIVLYTLITGNRIIILPVIISIILKYIYINNKNLNFKTIIVIGILGFMVIYLVYFLRLLRIYGGFYNMVTNNSIVELNKKNFEMILSGDGELSLRNAFYHFIYYNNNFNNFNMGHTYIRLLLIVIPTSLIPGIKPPDFAISMGSAWSMNPYNTTYSMHPTLYGDCFANLWWFGILLGIFWALFSFFIDKFIIKKNEVVRMMLMVLFSTAFVIAGRGSVYNGFFIAFAGTIIVAGINLASRINYIR